MSRRGTTKDLIGPCELDDPFLYYLIHCGFRSRTVAVPASKAFGDTGTSAETPETASYR